MAVLLARFLMFCASSRMIRCHLTAKSARLAEAPPPVATLRAGFLVAAFFLVEVREAPNPLSESELSELDDEPLRPPAFFFPAAEAEEELAAAARWLPCSC